jgi:SAM-dependent MidA family methyltransferase
MLARHVAQGDQLLEQPEVFDVLECGPGRGTLAGDLLAKLRTESPDTFRRLRYTLLETSPKLQKAQEALLAAEYADKVRWVTDLHELPGTLRGAVIGNEFIDAFPVHVVRNVGGEILEEYVAVDETGNLTRTYDQVSDSRLHGFLEASTIDLAENETIEVCLAAADWIEKLSAHLQQGVALFLDYGDIQPARYSAARRQGTLLSYRQGQVTDDLLGYPGEQDITALVDFTHMADAGRSVGFDLIGMVRQAAFLVGLGLGEGNESPLAQDDVDAALSYRRGMQALISMEGLGRFHVLVLGKNVHVARAQQDLLGLRYQGIL